MQVTFTQLQQWLGDLVLEVSGDASATLRGITTDSRAVVPGNLFVALRGDRFDAHDFLPAVVAQGAAAVIVDRLPQDLQVAAIVVSDTRVALGRLAQHWRRQFAVPVIGVTGSNGKTTVKEMIAAILAAAFGEDRYLATRGNFNNEIGVPLTLFRMQPQHQAAVIELGMNHPGEIAVLSDIARPTLGLVNNAQREHQEFMATVEAVARENGAVIEALAADGVAVFPADDEYTALWQRAAGSRCVLTFGLSDAADVSANYQPQAFGSLLQVRVRADGTRQAQAFEIQLAAAGEHNVRNALAAIACTLGAGIAAQAVVQGLQAFAPVNGRLQRKTAASGALVIDDTYNANPDSVRAAIDVLAQAAAPRVLVLGDMGEVGNEGQRFHEEIGAYAQQRGINHFFVLGELSRHAVAAFNAAAATPASGAGAQHFVDIEAINGAATQAATVGATVLVKGSRFMKMERVVQHLVGAQSGAQPQQENH
ncbi:UDP-N-acetylmuramoyl-tripeptide--D-alanyl-D-alanine ligase [Herbaspirillum autotrophicum]|uniref:UDP-N-acetylmuramoyl-tripeptide--D-alanyl-D- alanine ligase n=1 Tax=Herbaspirillum autotrophicum TaxID=180195 RepID=UPI00067DDEEA|nr:UDP-N-acetylmuramoyl-tripeptide--D-alanyl-D-alanine ligase [Herbaspirillum autotrophicum]